MSSLPTGTVSLLFSDIEGSTRLLNRLGPAYAEVLAAHRALLRAAWGERGGIELGTEGDSFYVAFGTAPDALAAAIQAQVALAAESWPGRERIRVRIGIHTGNPAIVNDAYVGMDVHRAARIAASAHGGQIVLSAATAELAAATLPDGVSLVDLGTHNLKDLPRPERLLQVATPQLQLRFPPLRTLGNSSSLPASPTPIVGRDRELDDLVATLSRPTYRIVTLTGAGGAGKTRLALEVARRLAPEYADGCYFVALASATTRDEMQAAILDALRAEPPDRSDEAAFRAFANRRALVVLDNLEQLADAASVVADLIRDAPGLSLVATSRHPLHLPGELEYAVEPLPLPAGEGLAAATDSDAVRLFVLHARRVRSDFVLDHANVRAVVEVCRRLDGLPLALELVAARSRVLAPAALLRRMDTVLDMAVALGDVTDRQRSLRTTIGWSYDLLRPPHQSVFCRLGVFAGGADLDAVSAVAMPDSDLAGSDCLDLVADLVDASLLTVGETTDGEPRVSMLEAIRAFAVDRLAAAGELDVARGRHARYYLAAAMARGPRFGSDQYRRSRLWFEAEDSNFREALNWCLPERDDDATDDRTRLGLALCAALGHHWTVTGTVADSVGWLQRAIERADDRDDPDLARCLHLIAVMLKQDRSGDFSRAREYAEHALAMRRRLDDPVGSAAALDTLGAIELFDRNRAKARELINETISVGANAGSEEHVVIGLANLAILEDVEGNHDRALTLHTRVLEHASRAGEETFALMARHNIAGCHYLLGESQLAWQELRKSVEQELRLEPDAGLISVAETMAVVLADLGRFATAAVLLGVADETRERLQLNVLPIMEGTLRDTATEIQAELSQLEWNVAHRYGRSLDIAAALTAAADETLRSPS